MKPRLLSLGVIHRVYVINAKTTQLMDDIQKKHDANIDTWLSFLV